jgi:hypothetical protein
MMLVHLRRQVVILTITVGGGGGGVELETVPAERKFGEIYGAETSTPLSWRVVHFQAE